MYKWFIFSQNNSGGYCIQKGIANVLTVIESPNAQHANMIAESSGMFNLPYCECCGVRFYPLYDDSESFESLDDVYNECILYHRYLLEGDSSNITIVPFAKDSYHPTWNIPK